MPIFSFVPVMNRNSEYAAYEIGDYSYGYPTIIANEYRSTLKIGKFCSIGDGVVIFLGGEHRTDCVTTYPISNFFAFAAASETVNKEGGKGPTVIGNDVWIGHDAFILNGVTIGDGAVIGAKAVVAKDIPPYAVAVGNPARVVKYRFPADICQKMVEIAWWNWSIEKVAEEASLLSSPDLQPFLAKYGRQHDPSAP